MDPVELQELLGFGVTENGQEHRFVVAEREHDLPDETRRYVIYNFAVTLDDEEVFTISSRYSDARKQHRVMRSGGKPSPAFVPGIHALRTV
eukprot:SAG22_NODE_4984_length_1115_cov_1.589567_1_plen_90_part_10